MKGIVVIVLTGIFSFSFICKKKKKQKSNIENLKLEHVLKVTAASKTFLKGGVRAIGNIYSFTVVSLETGIVIDSIHFKNYVVPCDVYITKTRTKLETLNAKDVVDIKANENLYEYKIAEARESDFRNEATEKPVIYYKQNGIRKKIVVEIPIVQLQSKPVRDLE